MTYCTFEEELMEQVSGYMKITNPDATLRLVPTVRNNEQEERLLVIDSPAYKESPAIRLRELYASCTEEVEIAAVAQQVCQSVEAYKGNLKFDIEEFWDFAKAKDKIIFRLIHARKNWKRLKNMPYKPYMDLAIVFLYRLEQVPEGEGTIAITNEIAGKWHTTVEQLWELAWENTQRIYEPEGMPLQSFLQEFKLGDMPDTGLWLLTNKRRSFGAGVLLYDGVLDGFANRFQSDFYILPSSVHEVLLLPMEQDMELADFHEMVQDANSEAVKPDEVLSDHAYYYSRKLHRIVY